MDDKLFKNLIIGIWLIICLLFVPQNTMASDYYLIYEQGERIVATPEMDHISQYMYNIAEYYYFDISIQIDGLTIFLYQTVETDTDWGIRMVKKRSYVTYSDINFDDIPDYVITLAVSRDIDCSFVIDGQTNVIIFSSEWRKADQRFDSRDFYFGQGWIIEKIGNLDSEFQNHVTKYIYYWSDKEQKFILSETK